MTAEDIARAKLYARSAAYAEGAGNANLAATFTRRGIALAGDVWPQLYADRDTDGVTGQDVPQPAEAKPEDKQAKRNADALTRTCPKCDAQPGERCTNYKGSPCAPHGGR